MEETAFTTDALSALWLDSKVVLHYYSMLIYSGFVFSCSFFADATKPLNWGYLTQIVDISKTTYLILTKIDEDLFQTYLSEDRIGSFRNTLNFRWERKIGICMKIWTDRAEISIYVLQSSAKMMGPISIHIPITWKFRLDRKACWNSWSLSEWQMDSYTAISAKEV